MPNIKGTVWDLALQPYTESKKPNCSGCFYQANKSQNDRYVATATKVSETDDGFALDASRSSAVYGKSDTVQPPAYLVNFWKRVS